MHLGREISSFIVPRHYELYGTETKIDSLGNRLISPNNCLWLTNLDYKKGMRYCHSQKNTIKISMSYMIILMELM